MSNESEEYLDNLNSEDYHTLRDFFDNYNEEKEKIRIEDVSPEMLKDILDDLKKGRKRKANFRVLSKRAMSNYMENGKWSNLEEIVKEILEELGLEEDKDWYHNFKLHNEEGSGYFELDFLLPDEKLIIESDGEVWHSVIGEAKKKDRRRDNWLSRLGFETVRIPGKELYSDRSKGKEIIENAIDDSKENES